MRNALTELTSTGKLVSAERLLDQIFDKNCKPSIRWLRSMTKNKTIPSYKIGHLVFFDPEMVKAALTAKNLIKGRYSLPTAQPKI